MVTTVAPMLHYILSPPCLACLVVLSFSDHGWKFLSDVQNSFHVDHAASLPYVLAKTNFKGRVFMTHPTKAIYKWLIQDNVRVQ